MKESYGEGGAHHTVSNATSVLPAISVSLAGLTLSQTDQHGCTTTYGYDALLRQIRAETHSGSNNERLGRKNRKRLKGDAI